MIQPSTNRPDTTNPYAAPILAKLRNRRYMEDPAHDGISLSGDKSVWYKVDKASIAGTAEGPQALLQAVNECFRKEGLEPSDSRVLKGLDNGDTRHTLSFDFDPAQSAQVNAAVSKINEASRLAQQKQTSVFIGK